MLQLHGNRRQAPDLLFYPLPLFLIISREIRQMFPGILTSELRSHGFEK